MEIEIRKFSATAYSVFPEDTGSSSGLLARYLKYFGIEDLGWRSPSSSCTIPCLGRKAQAGSEQSDGRSVSLHELENVKCPPKTTPGFVIPESGWTSSMCPDLLRFVPRSKYIWTKYLSHSQTLGSPTLWESEVSFTWPCGNGGALQETLASLNLEMGVLFRGHLSPSIWLTDR